MKRLVIAVSLLMSTHAYGALEQLTGLLSNVSLAGSCPVVFDQLSGLAPGICLPDAATRAAFDKRDALRERQKLLYEQTKKYKRDFQKMVEKKLQTGKVGEKEGISLYSALEAFGNFIPQWPYKRIFKTMVHVRKLTDLTPLECEMREWCISQLVAKILKSQGNGLGMITIIPTREGNELEDPERVREEIYILEHFLNNPVFQKCTCAERVEVLLARLKNSLSRHELTIWLREKSWCSIQ